MLLTLLTLFESVALQFSVGLVYPKWLYTITMAVPVLIPPSYVLCLALTRITPKISKCFIRSKTLLLERMSQVKDKEEEEGPPLLDQGGADYNTF